MTTDNNYNGQSLLEKCLAEKSSSNNNKSNNIVLGFVRKPFVGYLFPSSFNNKSNNNNNNNNLSVRTTTQHHHNHHHHQKQLQEEQDATSPDVSSTSSSESNNKIIISEEDAAMEDGTTTTPVGSNNDYCSEKMIQQEQQQQTTTTKTTPTTVATTDTEDSFQYDEETEEEKKTTTTATTTTTEKLATTEDSFQYDEEMEEKKTTTTPTTVATTDTEDSFQHEEETEEKKTTTQTSTATTTTTTEKIATTTEDSFQYEEEKEEKKTTTTPTSTATTTTSEKKTPTRVTFQKQEAPFDEIKADRNMNANGLVSIFKGPKKQQQDQQKIDIIPLYPSVAKIVKINFERQPWFDDDVDDDDDTVQTMDDTPVDQDSSTVATMTTAATGNDDNTTVTTAKPDDGPEITLDALTLVLSLEDKKLNRIGMEKLYELVKRSKETHQDKEARAIVIGGAPEKGSSEERFRISFLYFLCKDEDAGFADDDKSAVWSLYSVAKEQYVAKKDWLELHLLALKILSRALDYLIRKTKHTVSVNFQDGFWPTVLDTLLHNVERLRLHDNSIRITGYSLKIFRLLHSIDPSGMHQMLQQTLLPYVTHLNQICSSQQEGQQQQQHQDEEGGRDREGKKMIEFETSRLLKKADVEEVGLSRRGSF